MGKYAGIGSDCRLSVSYKRVMDIVPSVDICCLQAWFTPILAVGSADLD